jgi:dihydroorotate dehydrogenase
LLSTLQSLNLEKPKQKPILLKIAPDLTDEQLLDIIDIVKETQIAGVIATNTTLSRDNLISENKSEMGGLSGKPLTKRSTEVIRFLSEKSGKLFRLSVLAEFIQRMMLWKNWKLAQVLFSFTRDSSTKVRN